jgi:hypothetical protein
MNYVRTVVNRIVIASFDINLYEKQMKTTTLTHKEREFRYSTIINISEFTNRIVVFKLVIL